MTESSKKILTLPLRLALVVLIFGALFKIMHWPYAKELMFFGGITTGVLYAMRFLYKSPKKRIDYVKLGIVFLWLFSYLIQVFHLYKVPYLIEICLVMLIIWWLIEDGFQYFKSRKFKKKGIYKVGYYILSGLALFTLLFGLLFKIQHWPYGPLLFVIGVLMLCILLILDYFVIEIHSKQP